jgi:hypothetical protein
MGMGYNVHADLPVRAGEFLAAGAVREMPRRHGPTSSRETSTATPWRPHALFRVTHA